MKLKIYQVDAFSSVPFGGNPAAVVPLDSWLSDELLLSIAAENNLAETAFFVKAGEAFELRWFTPTMAPVRSPKLLPPKTWYAPPVTVIPFNAFTVLLPTP